MAWWEWERMIIITLHFSIYHPQQVNKPTHAVVRRLALEKSDPI